MLYGQLLQQSRYEDAAERVYLRDEEEGKICLDVSEKMGEARWNGNKEVVVVLLHGIAGESDDAYMKEMTGYCIRNGYNVVRFNHYSAKNEKDLRLMDFTKQKYMNEVIQYAVSRFQTTTKQCNVYLIGYSLGGNHILLYQGKSCKMKILEKPEENDMSSNVKGIISVSNPFDVASCAIKLKYTSLGFFDKVFYYRLYGAFKSYSFMR